LLELVNGLLDYTRLEAGVERLELRPVQLSELVEHVARPFFGLAEDKGLTLRVDVGEQPIEPIMGDREKLEHVLRSYLGNAIKFTPPGGCVTVKLARDPDQEGCVRVAVSDSGIGLRDEQIARVWERFYQGDASLTRPYGGMGLGLSIARHLVQLHGGAVGAESDGPGQGSTFWFSIPRQTSG
jgi:signal transduction histidine kinase